MNATAARWILIAIAGVALLLLAGWKVALVVVMLLVGAQCVDVIWRERFKETRR